MMTKDRLINYLQGCIALAEDKVRGSTNDGLAYVRPELLREAIALIPTDEPEDGLTDLLREVLIADDGNVDTATTLPYELIDRIRNAVKSGESR